MVENESSGGKTVTVTATDKDGDSIHAEGHGAEVWLTIREPDGDYHQVRLSSADAQQFAVKVADLAAA